MIWYICFFLSIAVFCCAAVLFVLLYTRKSTSKGIRKGINILLVSTIFSAFLLCLPIDINKYTSVFDGIFISIQNVFQVFSLDSNFEDFCRGAEIESAALKEIYVHFGALLHFLAPVLTLGLLLTFFKTLVAYIRIHFGQNKNLYVFSDLSNKSFQLAKDCIENDSKKGIKSLAVFTDVYEENNELSHELSENVSQLSAICLKKDILSINFTKLLKRKTVNFIIIGPDENENLDHSLGLIERYGKSSNAKLFSFIKNEESELFISSANTSDIKMQIRTVDINQLFVYNYIFKNDLFKNYIPLQDNRKLFSIVIIGNTGYAKELLKAMLWVYQYPDFELEINVFSKNKYEQSVFEAECPEIMKFSGCEIDGESKYKLNFHTFEDGECSEIYFKTKQFENEILAIKNITCVFTALESDEENIDIAIRLRRLFEKSFENKPEINAISSEMSEIKERKTESLSDFRNEKFNINFFGSIAEVYSYSVLFNSELEKQALDRHLEWYKKENAKKEIIEEKSKEFFKHKYYYKSSMASVIRVLGRKRANIPGAEKLPKERNADEKYLIMKAEHMGWNAYMRTEGYTYGANRNDLAKTHYDLVAFEELSYEEKIKDEI